MLRLIRIRNVHLLECYVLAAGLLASSQVHAISHRTLFAATGAMPLDELGRFAVAAGDVNGDGYADMIAGAAENDESGTDAGRAYVYFGGPAADGVADLTLAGEASNNNFGFSAGRAGDVNGDGFDDVIVGAYRNSTGASQAGRAYIYYGGSAPDASADWILTGTIAGDALGWSVGTAGDVNGDGYSDVIVGAPSHDATGIDVGQAHVYFGGPGADATADATFTGAASYDNFGQAVGTAGDLNQDGYADLIVGAQSAPGGLAEGRAYVYFGGPFTDAIADLTVNGTTSEYLGACVGTPGDVNADGYDDAFIGAPNLSSPGRVYVLYGGPGVDGTPDLTLTGTTAFDYLGQSAGAGDVNGDGYPDLIAGSPGAIPAAVKLYYGGPSIDAVADLTLIVGGDFSYGRSVGAGDVDGDGYADVIAGASGPSNAGRVYVTSLYTYQILSPRAGDRWVVGQSVTVRWRGRDVADIGASVDGGLNWSTLTAGVGGNDENEITITAPPVPTTVALLRITYTGMAPSRATSATSGAFSILEDTPPAPVVATQVMAPSGLVMNDQFGGSVSDAGDVNGDGSIDTIVGAVLAGGLNEGRAYIHYGGPGADAVADIILSGEAGNDYFGNSVSGAGDVNGDGYDDVIVGAHRNSAGGYQCGRAYVYFGGAAPDNVADLTLTGEAAGDEFGFAVSGAGDVNGDGYADAIVGAPQNTTGGGGAGRAYVFFGGPFADNFPDVLYTGTNGDFFGWSVNAAGDVNDDGFADVIVGAIFAGVSDQGQVHVFHGGSSPNATADLTLTGELAYDYFGISVAGAGDVNGDGVDDIVVGAGYALGGTGRAYVFHGGPAADATADLSLTGPTPSGNFGNSVAGAHDVNGDGYRDVIVGAPYAAGGGRAYLILGGPAADESVDLALAAPGGTTFGASVSGVSPVTGDGFADVIVGAYGDGPGRAYIHRIQRYAVSAPNGGEVWNVGALRTINWRGAEPADVLLSVDGGLTYDRLETAVGGEEDNLLSIRVPHSPTRFARVRIVPTDVSVTGGDRSDSLFTIQTSVSLLSLAARISPLGGAEITWSSDPGVGPEGLAGYRLFRIDAGTSGNGARIGPDLIEATHYLDSEGKPGDGYRLSAVNGLMEEMELGRVMIPGPPVSFRVWPTPLIGAKALQVTFTAPMAAPGFPASDLDVAIFDMQGRRVATLARGAVAAGRDGEIRLEWSARSRGRTASGVYILRAAAPSARFRVERKVVIVP